MSFENLFGLEPVESTQPETNPNTTNVEVQDSTVQSQQQTSNTSQRQEPAQVKNEVPREEVRQEQQQPQQEQQTFNGYTAEELQAINNNWNNYFQYDPFTAITQGLESGFSINLDDSQKSLLNQKYLEWFDTDPLGAQQWQSRIAFLENSSKMKAQEQEHQKHLETTDSIIKESQQAVEQIILKHEYFKEPVYNEFLFRLANALAEDNDPRVTSPSKAFETAAEMIHQGFDNAYKQGYDSAKKELTRKSSAYVEGSGNLIPPRTSKDDEADAVAKGDLDAILSAKLRNLKKVR